MSQNAYVKRHSDDMFANLDELDNRILALLMDNARLPVASIAKQLGVARTTVIARIANLERKGVIAGYGLRLNRDEYQPAVRAYVGIALDPHRAPAFLKMCAAMPEVECLCAVSGVIDYMLTLRCKSTAEMDRVLDRIGAADGVRQTSTSIILSTRIDRGGAAESA